MTRFNERDRFFFTIVAIAASVFLFACGSGEKADSGVTLAEKVRAARRGHGLPETATVAKPAAADTASSAAEAPSVPAPPATQEPPLAASQPSGDASLRQAEVISSTRIEPGPAPITDSAPSPAESSTPALRDPSGARVFSNKDLERYRRTKEDFGFREGVVTVDVTRRPSEETTGGNEGAAGEKMTRAEREAELNATQDRIKILIQELDYLKKRVLPLENPFLARPTVSEQDKLAESGMGNDERLQRVKEQIGKVEGELNGLQRRFAELQSIKPSDVREEPQEAGTPDRE